LQKGGEHAPGCVAQGGLVRPGGGLQCYPPLTQ